MDIPWIRWKRLELAAAYVAIGVVLEVFTAWVGAIPMSIAYFMTRITMAGVLGGYFARRPEFTGPSRWRILISVWLMGVGAMQSVAILSTDQAELQPISFLIVLGSAFVLMTSR